MNYVLYSSTFSTVFKQRTRELLKQYKTALFPIQKPTVSHLGRWGVAPDIVDKQLRTVVYNDYCIGPPNESR